MPTVSVIYPRREGATFDFDYFRTKHLPEVGKAFKPFGLGYASVLRGEQTIDGGAPAFFVTTILSFPTEDAARKAAASKEGQALAADFPNFTSATPVPTASSLCWYTVRVPAGPGLANSATRFRPVLPSLVAQNG